MGESLFPLVFSFKTPHHVVDASPFSFLHVLKELISDGATWIDSLTSVLTKQDLNSLRRELAIKVLHLND